MKDNSLGALMVFLIAIVALILLDDLTQSKLDTESSKITENISLDTHKNPDNVVISDEID